MQSLYHQLYKGFNLKLTPYHKKTASCADYGSLTREEFCNRVPGLRAV